MESEIAEMRSKRDYYTRRLNVTCPLSVAQAEAAIAYLMRTGGTREEAEVCLAKQRFCWDGMTVSSAHLQGALEDKRRLLDAIEAAGPLANPCLDCYHKSPEAKAEKRKRQAEAKQEAAAAAAGLAQPAGSAAAPAAKRKRVGAKVQLGTQLPAVTSDNVTAGAALPDAAGAAAP